MTFQELTDTLAGKTWLNGWDAVCAVNVDSLNSALLQWYLADGPLTPETPIQAILEVDNTYYILEVLLGPPELQFSTNLEIQQCQCTMQLVSGSLAQFDPRTNAVGSILFFQPAQATLSGILNLAKAPGDASSTGELTLDLTSGAYTPAISGIDPKGTLGAALVNAVGTYFVENAVVFRLGSVWQSSSLPPSLMPQSFEIAVQTNASSQKAGDGCVLMLMQTTGGGGTVSALANYPIADESTASLLVSNEVVFNNLFLTALNKANSSNKLIFTSPSSGGLYTLLLGSCATSLGVLTVTDNHFKPQTSDGVFDKQHFVYEGAPMVVDLSGLTIEFQNASLSWNYSKQWNQGFAYSNTNTPQILNQKLGSATATLTYSASTAGTISTPSTCVVTFPLSGSANFTFKLSKVLEGEIGECNFGALVTPGIESAIENIFNSIAIVPGIDTFALQALLFYPNQWLSLSSVSLPADLLLVGDVKPQMVISPVQVTCARGGSAIPFSATWNGDAISDLTWEIKPSQGTMLDGTYTPPTDTVKSLAVMVSAASESLSRSANALVLVSSGAASSGVLVGPSVVAVSAGQSYVFSFTNANSSPIDVTCSLSPSGAASGTVANDFGWTYTAPAQVTSPLTVTLTATGVDDASLTGTAAIYLVNSNAMQITASPTSLQPGGTSALSTVIPDSIDEIIWIPYNSTGDPAGAIVPSADDSSQATYTAPASLSENATIQIVAYGYTPEEGAVAFGTTSVTVNTA